MGRMFNVLFPVIVLFAYFQDGSGFNNYGNSFDTFSGTGGFSGGAAGSGAIVGQAEYSGGDGGPSWSSGTGNGYGSMNVGNGMDNGNYENSAAYNGGNGWGYSQGGGAYNGGFNAQYGFNSVSGGNGRAVQYDSHPDRSFMREVAGDIAETVVDAIEIGHSLMHRPHVKQNYVHYSRPAYVRKVVQVPRRVVSVRRGYAYRGCHY